MQVELLLDHARAFPPLPERFRAARAAGVGRVTECQAEVYFFPEVADGRVRIHADIPGEAPTQRALVGILMEAYDGATPAEVAAIPDDLLRAPRRGAPARRAAPAGLRGRPLPPQARRRRRRLAPS